jgi:hypothetical protein
MDFTLYSAMHEEEQQWLEAAKLGLGYLGFPGHPFANYYPPWVMNPSMYGLKQTTSKQSNVGGSIAISMILIITGSLMIADTISRRYLKEVLYSHLRNNFLNFLFSKYMVNYLTFIL